MIICCLLCCNANARSDFLSGVVLGAGASATSGFNLIVGYHNPYVESGWLKHFGARIDFAVTAPLKSVIDSVIDSYYRDALSSMSYFETLADNGLSLESLANEFSDTGLSSYINSFFEAANSLSLYPTDITMKTNFIQQASNLATAIKNISNQLVDARRNLVGDISNPATLETSQVKVYTDEINQIIKDIADINANIIYLIFHCMLS